MTKFSKDLFKVFFPELVRFKQGQRYFRIIGPLVLGLEVKPFSSGEAYCLYYTYYGLWPQINVAKPHDLKYPGAMFSMKNVKLNQLKIYYDRQEVGLRLAAEKACIDKFLPLLSTITFSDITGFLSFVEKNSPRIPFHAIKMFEAKFYLHLFFAKISGCEEVLNEIRFARPLIPMDNFELFFGPFDVWLQQLEENLNNRTNFLERVEEVRGKFKPEFFLDLQ